MIDGRSDEFVICRQLLYLDGLQKCNSIDDELIADIDQRVVRRFVIQM